MQDAPLTIQFSPEGDHEPLADVGGLAPLGVSPIGPALRYVREMPGFPLIRCSRRRHRLR
jgi:hypothetical protein